VRQLELCAGCLTIWCVVRMPACVRQKACWNIVAAAAHCCECLKASVGRPGPGGWGHLGVHLVLEVDAPRPMCISSPNLLN